MTIDTPRLMLVPATAALVGLELSDPQALGRALQADVPPDWPPALIRDSLPWFRSQLEDTPALTGWLCWYAIVRNGEGGVPTLAASGGFIGPPVLGAVEIGYSLLPEFQGWGYATEMMGALLEWAFTHPDVSTIAAEALPDNFASRRVLAKLGFVPSGTANEPGHLRFERRRA